MPDGSVNKEALAPAGHVVRRCSRQRLAQDIARRQVLLGVAGTVLAPASNSAAAMDALLQQREVQVLRFDAKDYAAKINPSDAELEAYYKDPAHAAQFMAPEQATIEYVVLDLDTLKKGVSVSDDELRKYYDENATRYTAPEERRASHILIKADKGAPAADREKAKAKAEALLAELKKNPAAFAELAKKNSDDPGSAERGGDLDFFARGAMVKPFEDAAFALKPGEISARRRDRLRLPHHPGHGGARRREAQLRGGARRDRRRGQAASWRSGASPRLAVEFTNTVYEQPDSLKPVADKLKLEIQHAPGRSAHARAGRDGPAGLAEVPGRAVRQRCVAQQAQHRGGRDRPEPARLRSHRELRAGAPAAVRRREGQGARAVVAEHGGGAGAQGRRSPPGRLQKAPAEPRSANRHRSCRGRSGATCRRS